MKIGIISDSHGGESALVRALGHLHDRGAEAIVHCGDITTVAHVEILAGYPGQVRLAAGNMDRRILVGLAAAAREEGVDFGVEYVTLALSEGDRLAAAHGHEFSVLEQLAADGDFRYVCYGHTHRREDVRRGHCRLINPGALCKPDHGPSSAALLDTASDELAFLDIFER